MADLRRLESFTPTPVPVLPKKLCEVITPLRVEAWSRALRHHPDQEFAGYIVRGIQQGFRIGYNRRAGRCQSAKRNMLSAEQNPEVVDQYLRKEKEAGRVVGPLPQHIAGLHVSRFGVIPKPHQPGKWRLIVDLSHPKGASVNDGIDPELCSLVYTSVDEAVNRVLQRGRGALLAKIDIASAYRIIPVHPHDRPLLAMRWKEQLLVDTALPFGLRSAPKIFSAVADALLWVMCQEGVQSALHYLDDFLFVGAPESDECKVALGVAQGVCQWLGAPLALEKREGPARILPFLGIVLDTEKLELRLPEEKLQRLRELIRQWQGKKSCRKRELLSVIGQLQHACRVVKPGRTFLRRMIELSTTAHELYHHIRLNRGFQSDLEWWALFLSEWNGVGMMVAAGRATPQAVLTSDASGNWGCGAFSSAGEWFQCPWPSVWAEVHITVKELLPIVMACAMWGQQWQGKTILCRSDNAAVVAIINSGRSKDPLAMHLMRSLFFLAAKHSIVFRAEHLPGHLNGAADALSRDNLPLFFQQVPVAQRAPTPVPQELLDVLVVNRPDWTSTNWRHLFNIISRKA